MKKASIRFLSLLLSFLLAFSLISCDMGGGARAPKVERFSILDESIEVELDGEYQLRTNLSADEVKSVQWSVSNQNVMVTEEGVILGIKIGMAEVRGEIDGLSDSVKVRVVEPANPQNPTPPKDPPATSGASASFDPYKEMNKQDFYANYKPADCLWDARWRSYHNLMSGMLTVPDQAPVLSDYRPRVGTKFLRNTDMFYSENGNAYTVVDAYGDRAFTVYEGGAYITIEEVAAYVFAFGDVPANYDADKDAEPRYSAWGEYLRVNHTHFSGNTSRYPYEPALPNISGCGGSLYYMEIDIGTTGTDCDPQYPVAIYNNGNRITRGAARIVYGKSDLNGNGIYERGEHHVFYTYNHYNDFREYLNYYGGWGEMFGNITGGGSISSKYDYNPTAYVEVAFGRIFAFEDAACVWFILPPSYSKRASTV